MPSQAGSTSGRIFPGLVAALFCAAPVAWAQPASDAEVLGSGGDITVELDTARQKNEGRSLALALLGSALLPGAGEAYLREQNSAKAFLLAEAGFWAGLFMAFQARENYLQSARNYAVEYAGAPAQGKDEDYLNALASYRAYEEKEHRQDSYELAQVISGKRDGKYTISSADAWDFGSSNTPENTRHWREFQSVMRYYRGSKVVLSFAVGALALNRVAALAHTLRVYRRTSGRGLSYRIDPDIAPESAGIRLTLAF